MLIIGRILLLLALPLFAYASGSANEQERHALPVSIRASNAPGPRLTVPQLSCWDLPASVVVGSDQRGAASPYIIQLSEDFDFALEQPGARGATVVVHGEDERSIAAAHAAASAVNALLPHEAWTEHWAVETVAGEDGAAVVIEFIASAKNPRHRQRPAIRVRQFRHATAAALASLGHARFAGAAGFDPDLRPSLDADRELAPLRIAVLDDGGSVSSSGHGPLWLLESLEAALGRRVPANGSAARVELVCAAEIRGGALRGFAVLVIGGGLSKTQARTLGAAGCDRIRAFVAGGGGYVGICAGAFLASQNDYGLGLVPFTAKSGSGSGVVELAIHEPAGRSGPAPVKHSGGPRLDPTDARKASPAIEDLEIWARYAADLPRKGSAALDLEGRVAIASNRFGKGRVVITGPHCERSPGPQDVFLRMVQFAAGGRERF